MSVFAAELQRGGDGIRRRKQNASPNVGSHGRTPLVYTVELTYGSAPEMLLQVQRVFIAVSPFDVFVSVPGDLSTT